VSGVPPAAGEVRVTARPRRLRVVCWFCAAGIVVLFSLVATALRGTTEGGGSFQAGDQAAMVGLGLCLAGAVLAFARPRVDAGPSGIHVRNILGTYDLPWAVVREVRFEDGAPWASLELADDDTVAVMAVQAADKEYAVQAVQGLRALLAAHRAAQ